MRPAHTLLGRAPGTLVGRSVMEAFLDAACRVDGADRPEPGHGTHRAPPGRCRRADADGPGPARAPAAACGSSSTTSSELRRLQRIRTEFIDNLSHELRTPLTTVSLLAETLSREADAIDVGLPPKMRDRIGKIEVETGHLVQMVNELLDLSRIESGGTLDARRRAGHGPPGGAVGGAAPAVRGSPGRHPRGRRAGWPAAGPRRRRPAGPGRRQPRPQRREVQPRWRGRSSCGCATRARRSSRRSRITGSASRATPRTASSSGSTRSIARGCGPRRAAARASASRSPGTSSSSTAGGSGSNPRKGPARRSRSPCRSPLRRRRR